MGKVLKFRRKRYTIVRLPSGIEEPKPVLPKHLNQLAMQIALQNVFRDTPTYFKKTGVESDLPKSVTPINRNPK